MKYEIHFISENVDSILVEVNPIRTSDEHVLKILVETLHLAELVRIWKTFDTSSLTEGTMKVFEMLYRDEKVEVAIHVPDKYKMQTNAIAKVLAFKLKMA